MTTVVNTVNTTPNITSRLASGLLSIKPLANLARHQARQMMIKRAASLGVDWIGRVNALMAHDLDAELKQVQNPQVNYPAYYLNTFHAYDDGNLSWEAATEVEVAAYAVHARIWQDTGAEGDARLRQSYSDVLQAQIRNAPAHILDLGCSVGMSTLTLRATYPQANITGLDLSPYFLAIANYQSRQNPALSGVKWVHAAAESTGLPDASFDLVSTSLLFHELPQAAAIEILREVRRLLKPHGHLAIMDTNPKSEVYTKMPPYVFTLLKSTEPYLDEYFAFDIETAIADAGFARPTLTCNTPRHRTIVAQAI